MRYVLYGILLIGGVGFGADFRDLIREFITHGIPDAWEEHVAANRCYQAIRNAFWVALGFPILFTVIAIAISRYNMLMAQAFITVGVSISFLIMGALLIVADIFAAVAIGISPLGENTRTRLQRIRRGFKKLVALGMSWVLFVGYILFMIGLEASIWAITASVWAIILYGMASYAFSLPITWIQPLMTNTGIWSFVAIFTVMTAMTFSTTQKYAAEIGLNPGKFVRRGVVDTSIFSTGEEAYQKRRYELCVKELGEKQTAMSTAQNVQALDNARKEYEERKKECFMPSQSGTDKTIRK